MDHTACWTWIQFGFNLDADPFAGLLMYSRIISPCCSTYSFCYWLSRRTHLPSIYYKYLFQIEFDSLSNLAIVIEPEATWVMKKGPMFLFLIMLRFIVIYSEQLKHLSI
jgi:hypothetical protein